MLITISVMIKIKQISKNKEANLFSVFSVYNSNKFKVEFHRNHIVCRKKEICFVCNPQNEITNRLLKCMELSCNFLFAL